jgi:hypothetical protein
MERYKRDVEKEIKALTTHKLEQLIEDSSSLTMDATSHKLCLIHRLVREDVYSRPMVSPITSSVQSRLANRFRTLERKEQIRLYKLFSKVLDSRATAGIFFEAAGQRRIQDGATLEFVPMVRLTSSRSGTNPRWYSSHILLRNASLEASRQQALQGRQFLLIPQCSPIEYTDDGPSSITPNVIYVPELTNQVALDSFIVVSGLLFMLQFTIGEEYDIKPGLVDFIGKCPGLPSMENWRFIFIHPPNHTLVCPQPWRLEMRKLHPFSAVLTL